MALPYPISANQTDAKSPIDDNLMDSIRLDLDYLDSQVSGQSFTFLWNVNGPLSMARGYTIPFDSTVTFQSITPNFCRAVLKKGGLSGNLKFDLRKVTTPLTPITGIDHQYSAATQSVGRVGSSLTTQSIARTTAQVATQSISYAKAQLSIESIVNIGTNLWRINFSGGVLLDSDYQVGKYIKVASATAGGNNGTFAIFEVNASGYPSIVVNNASGVAQTSAAGTVDLQLMSYNYSNPVNSDFVVGESALFAAHTTGANNGTFEIHKVNQAGNNIWIYNQTGVVQAGVAGTLDVLRWIFAYSSAVATDYVATEKALMAGHTSGGNNGNLTIVDVNRGGNNLIIYNTAGVAQGGSGGTANTNRWRIAMPTDPSSQVSVGHELYFFGHTSSANDGYFTIKGVNSSGNDLIVYNESGVAQAGIAGNVNHTRKLIKFGSDQSAVYTTLSMVEIDDTESATYVNYEKKEQYPVLEVNRGGGANYNIVIDGRNNPAQIGAAGFIVTEAKSLFNSVPTISASLTGNTENKILKFSTTDFVVGSIAANTPIMLYLLEIPIGGPEDLTVHLH